MDKTVRLRAILSNFEVASNDWDFMLTQIRIHINFIVG